MPSRKILQRPDEQMLASARKHFEGYLRKQELKLTSQRLEILDRVAAMNKHFNADEILDAFRRKKTKPSKATIYRTLNLLAECDILEEHNIKQESSVVYEFAWGRDHHDHMICLSCGTIIEFVDEAIETRQDEVCDEHGFHPTFHSQKIYGICSVCWGNGVRSV